LSGDTLPALGIQLSLRALDSIGSGARRFIPFSLLHDSVN
jgi:hypothetical protein